MYAPHNWAHGGPLVRLSQWLMGRPSWWVSRIQVPLPSSIWSLACCSPSHSLPPSPTAHDSVLLLEGEGNGPLRQHYKAGEEGAQSLPSPQFPLLEKSPAEKGPLGIELCHLGEGVTRVKSNCSSILSSMSILELFTPVRCWNFSAGLLGFDIGFLVCGDLSKSLFSWGSWQRPRRAGADSQPTAGSTDGPKSVCLFPDSWWVRLFLDVFAYGAGDRTKAKGGCSQVLRGMEMFLGP